MGNRPMTGPIITPLANGTSCSVCVFEPGQHLFEMRDLARRAVPSLTLCGGPNTSVKAELSTIVSRLSGFHRKVGSVKDRNFNSSKRQRIPVYKVRT
jgi:hypothetical protein